MKIEILGASVILLRSLSKTLFFSFLLEQPMDHNDVYKGLAIVG